MSCLTASYALTNQSATSLDVRVNCDGTVTNSDDKVNLTYNVQPAPNATRWNASCKQFKDTRKNEHNCCADFTRN
jgi:hypothetical protein